MAVFSNVLFTITKSQEDQSMPSSSPPLKLDTNAADAEDTKTTQLKSALWLPIGRLVDNTTLALDKNATPQFIGALTELVWCQIGSAAADVESFARHADRSVVSVEDVLLLARKNDMLKGLLEDFLEEERKRVSVEMEAKKGTSSKKRTSKK